jgi:hypothetical protein
MGMMKDYLMFLEEKGIAEWSDYFDDWQFSVDDIYAPELIKEYNESRLSVSQDN